MRIGFTELLVVFFVALIVIGPDKLPQYARKLGAALAEFRKASDEAAREIRENVVEPLDEAQRPLREAAAPVEDLGKAVREDLEGVEKSFRDIGKEKGGEKKAGPVPASGIAEAPGGGTETGDAEERPAAGDPAAPA